MVRDFYGRPYVSQNGEPLEYAKGRKSPVNAEPYTRISTMSGALEDKAGLIDWASARAMIGTVKSKAIFGQLAHLMSAQHDPWAVAETKKPLKELVRKAQELGGSEDAAGEGTAFHGLTECLDRGNEPAYIPEGMEPWLNEYWHVMQPWEPVLVEPFAVCDELKVAGSPDRYLRNKETGKIYCADIKTGTSEPDFPMKVMIQVAIGARAEQYDQQTGDRLPILCERDRGILIHAPIRAGLPRVHLYWLDLVKGWELAKLAYQVRESRKLPKLQRIT